MMSLCCEVFGSRALVACKRIPITFSAAVLCRKMSKIVGTVNLGFFRLLPQVGILTILSPEYLPVV